MRVPGFIFLVFLLGVSIHHAYPQSRTIDSLRNLISAEPDPAKKLQQIIDLSGQSINADTLLPYVLLGETISEKSGSTFDIDRIALVKASYYVRKNYVDSALAIVDQLIPAYKNNTTHQPFYLLLLFFRSKVLDRGNRYTKALTQLYQVVQTAEDQKDTLTLIQAKTGIGWVQMEMEQYKEALQWLFKALNTSTNKKFYNNYGALYSNIASTYNALEKPDSAKFYIDIAIQDARKNENLLFLATALDMQAKIFIKNRQPALAEAPLNEAVAIRKKLNDPFYTVYDMSTLASYYAANKQTQKGIELCKEGIAIAKGNGLSSQLLMIYHSLAENYKAAGKIPEYSATLESIITLKDSFNNINSSRLLSDMQAKTEAQKNEKTIIEQKLNLTIKNYWLFGSALFALMAGMLIWLGFKYHNRKQQLKMEMALADEKRNAAQSIIDAEVQERKRIAADLHDNIGAYASAIRADVEKISTRGFEENRNSLQNLEQHSLEIINSLRDTIWVLNKESITLTGISDRIKNYVNKLQPTYDGIQFHITENIRQDVRFSSKYALNIFRVTQEAIHNALKHSGTGDIRIDISSNEAIEIKISDYGKGIDPGKASTGNGLSNMQARAGEIGMKLSVIPGNNGGTVVSLYTNTTI